MQVKSRRFSFRETLIVASLCIMLTIALTLVVVGSPNGGGRDLWLDDFPSTATYVINADGAGNYWATRYDGKVVWSGTNATEVVQNAFDNLPEITANVPSGKLCFGSGIFELGTLNFTGKRAIVEGQGRWSTKLHFGPNGETNLIYINSTVNSWDFVMRDLSIHTLDTVGNNPKVLFFRNLKYIELSNIQYYGSNNYATKNITFLYLQNCYFGEINRLAIGKTSYPIYADGVYGESVFYTPTGWTVNDLGISTVEPSGTALWMRRCNFWTFNTLTLQSVNCTYRFHLNACAFFTINNLDITDDNQTVGIYMTGWSGRTTHLVTIMSSQFLGDDYCIEISGYTHNVTLMNCKFLSAPTALNITSSTGVSNVVLMNCYNLCTNYIAGKSYTEWNNGTYTAIP